MLKSSLAATLLALQLTSLGAPLLCDRGGHGETEDCVETVRLTSTLYTAAAPDARADCGDCARPDCARMLTCVSATPALVSADGWVLSPLEGFGPPLEHRGSDPDELIRPLAPPPRI